MHNEWSEAFWLGVEVLCSVVLLVATLQISATSNQLNDIMEQKNATAAILQDVREWKAYDGTHGLYEADVLSVYYKYGSNSVAAPATITVDGNNIKGVDSNQAIASVRADRRYSCNIVRDNTLVVTAVNFTTEP